MTDMKTLPRDISRCVGGSHQLCRTCARSLPSEHDQWYIAPAISFVAEPACCNRIPVASAASSQKIEVER